jgi:ABC-type antimicrobial peptide transport system permease subunit
MALGATLRDIVPAVFSTQFAMVVAGIVVGAAGAVGVGRAIVRLLPAAGGMDVPTVATAALLMLVAAALACIAPLRMVARVDPATALRD